LLRAVEAARRALGENEVPVVVLGSNALKLRSVLQRAAHPTRRGRPVVQVAYNALWSEGLAGSLRTGLDELPRSVSAALVLLVDQPDVDTGALRRLIAAWRKRPGIPAAAFYAGHRGVPAILPRRLWSKIRALDGDAGARALLRDATAITLVPMPEAELDVDTEQDLARL
jgi:molybdenum cofactor cytidylyltransferase